MSVTTPPEITAAWAFGAGGSFITTPIPTPPQGTNRASFTEGFPPITFSPEVSGGLPPDGSDFNGIFNMITAHCAYINAGQPYVYSSTVATAVSGYGTGAVLGMADGSGLWLCTAGPNSATPESNVTGWTAAFSYGFATLSGLTGGIVTLTPAQHRRSTVVLQGTLTSNLQVIFPTLLREWRIVNQCTGAFTVTVKTSAGTGVVVPSGGFASPTSVYGDATNLYTSVAPLALPLSVAPTPNSIPVRDGSAYIYAAYFNQSSALENLSITSIGFQTGSDGFWRKISPTNFAAQINVGTFAGQVTNAQVPVGAVTQHAPTLFTNSTLTGSPTAPTRAPGDNSIGIATTAFVQTAKPKLAGGTVTGATGAIVSSTGVNSVTRTSTGNYTIDVTAAGFTTAVWPTANITQVGANSDNIYIRANGPTQLLVQIRLVTTPVDRDFNFSALGV